MNEREQLALAEAGRAVEHVLRFNEKAAEVGCYVGDGWGDWPLCVDGNINPAVIAAEAVRVYLETLAK